MPPPAPAIVARKKISLPSPCGSEWMKRHAVGYVVKHATDTASPTAEPFGRLTVVVRYIGAMKTFFPRPSNSSFNTRAISRVLPVPVKTKIVTFSLFISTSPAFVFYSTRMTLSMTSPYQYYTQERLRRFYSTCESICKERSENSSQKTFQGTYMGPNAHFFLYFDF